MILDLRAQIHTAIIKPINENEKTERGTNLSKELRNAEFDMTSLWILLYYWAVGLTFGGLV